MGTRQLFISAKVLVLACVALVAMQVQRPGAVAAAGARHDEPARRPQPVAAASAAAAAQTRPQSAREL